MFAPKFIRKNTYYLSISCRGNQGSNYSNPQIYHKILDFFKVLTQFIVNFLHHPAAVNKAGVQGKTINN